MWLLAVEDIPCRITDQHLFCLCFPLITHKLGITRFVLVYVASSVAQLGAVAPFIMLIPLDQV